MRSQRNITDNRAAQYGAGRRLPAELTGLRAQAQSDLARRHIEVQQPRTPTWRGVLPMCGASFASGVRDRHLGAPRSGPQPLAPTTSKLCDCSVPSHAPAERGRTPFAIQLMARANKGKAGTACVAGRLAATLVQ